MEINTKYEDVLGLFVYDEVMTDAIKGHRERFIQITDKTINSVEYKECEGTAFRTWIESKKFEMKIKSVESEIDFESRKFINSEVRKQIINKINNRIRGNNGLRFINTSVV